MIKGKEDELKGRQGEVGGVVGEEPEEEVGGRERKTRKRRCAQETFRRFTDKPRSRLQLRYDVWKYATGIPTSVIVLHNICKMSICFRCKTSRERDEMIYTLAAHYRSADLAD